MRALALLTLLTSGCGSGGGAGDGGAAGTTAGDAGTTGGDLALGGPIVKLHNTSAAQNGDLVDIHFVVDDTAYPTRAIASIDHFSLVWIGGSADADFRCTQPPWIVGAETTDVLDISVGAGGTGPTLLFITCGVPNTQQPFYLPTMASVADSVLVEVDGTLNDGSTFKAVSGATIQ